MRLLSIFALFALAAFAQPDKATPIDKAKATELLDQAAGVIPAAHLEIQVASLRELGELYGKLDKKRAIEFFEQGFQAALALPDEKGVFLRSKNQGVIIERLAKLDADKALALLTQLSPGAADGAVKPRAYESVVQSLLETDNLTAPSSCWRPTAKASIRFAL